MICSGVRAPEAGAVVGGVALGAVVAVCDRSVALDIATISRMTTQRAARRACLFAMDSSAM